MRLFPRIAVLFETAVRMALHDRMKLAGALLGVVFATFLGGQQLGIFLGLVQKNTLLADGVQADIWIAPKNTKQAEASTTLPDLLHLDERPRDPAAVFARHPDAYARARSTLRAWTGAADVTALARWLR
jgi:hypothetical protein